MLTPFRDGAVDYPALEALVEWYIAHGVSGLFAVCQSSEMFFLSLEERVGIARFVNEKAAGPGSRSSPPATSRTHLRIRSMN